MAFSMAETQTALVSLLVAGMGPCPVTTVCLPSTTTELRSMRSLCNLDPSCTISIMISSPRRAIEPPLIDHRTRPFFLSFLHLLVDFSLIFVFVSRLAPLFLLWSFRFYFFYFFILFYYYYFFLLSPFGSGEKYKLKIKQQLRENLLKVLNFNGGAPFSSRGFSSPLDSL